MSNYDTDYEPHTVTVTKCTGPGHTPEPRTVEINDPGRLVYCEQGHRMHG